MLSTIGDPGAVLVQPRALPAAAAAAAAPAAAAATVGYNDERRTFRYSEQRQ